MGKKKYDHVYQFKITLQGIRPPIWRRIHVPETYSFWDLHVAIQDAMGWEDYHLHQFTITDPSTDMKVEIGIPAEGFDVVLDMENLPGWKQKIAEWFSTENSVAEYTYDFGDNWEHNVKLEKILPKEVEATYPRCIGGKRACPPEDCGGVWGYEEMLDIVADKTHEDYEETIEWLGDDFDQEHFDVNEITFDDPAKRRKTAMK